MSDFKKLFKKIDGLDLYIKNRVLTIVGTEAVKHFKKSFVDGGFTDSSLEKWEDVKRRDAKSPWYGYQAGANGKIPNAHPKRKGVKSEWKRRKDSSITNYSPTARKRKVLTGTTKNLMKSIKWKANADGKSVTITANEPYAQIHNEGGQFKVFGKKTATMPKRQFMGDSKVLRKVIAEMIEKDIKNILK